MRFAPFLLLLATPLQAELLATIQTTLGNVTVVLQYDKTPQTVANFITLAQGTRTRIDRRGALTQAPLYVGEKFFRVINDPTFRIAQTGSGTGTNSGGPGYGFRDEFHPTLKHTPYVLSMANSGVHSNGSQIFLTGDGTIPHLDNVHTIFGLVSDPASRLVVDAILASGDNGTTISGVEITRTDAAAEAFDEFAQDLPVCRSVPGQLSVSRNTATTYNLNNPLPPGTTLRASRSADLVTWNEIGELYQGTGQTGFSSVTMDGATLAKAFYYLTMVTYPDALTPASLAGRTLQIERGAGRTVTLAFDSTGITGTFTDSGDTGTPAPFELWGHDRAPYRTTIRFEVNKTTPTPQTVDHRISVTFNSENELEILGTHTFDQSNGSSWVRVASGGLTLTKP